MSKLTKTEKIILCLKNESYPELLHLRRFCSIPALRPHYHVLLKLVLLELLDRDTESIGGGKCECGSTRQFFSSEDSEIWWKEHENCPYICQLIKPVVL